MSEPASVLEGRSHAGLATVREATPMGMLSLRATLDAALGETLATHGLGLPERRQMTGFAAGRVGWMSPDELLILAPRETLATLRAALNGALAGRHHLLVDVSDARAVLRIEGAEASQVLAKLCPVDLLDGHFPEGELRRTRLAQVPAAFWRDAEGYTLICFRSVARYAFDALSVAACGGTGID